MKLRNPEMDPRPETSLFSALNFIIIIIIIIFISSAAADQTNITAEAGQDTFLPCRSPDHKPVAFVEWSRSDLGSEYVLLYRNKKINTENQHVMFKDRVDLQDRRMKDGNVSLVLRNVTTDDRGAYECRIVPTNSWMETVIIINLDVLHPPGGADGRNRDGSGWLIYLLVPLGGFVGFVVAVVVYLRRKKSSRSSPKSSQSSGEPPAAQQPLTDQNQPAEQ